MVALLDIAPLAKTARVGDQDVEVPGVSALGIAYLMQRFPKLRELIGKGSIDTSTLDADMLVTALPEGLAAVIACGCGYVNSPDAEAAAARLSADAQLDLLKTIIEVTMPKGVGPFVAKLEQMMSGLDVSVKAPGMPSPQPSKS